MSDTAGAGPSRPIEQLPPATQSKLRSTQILTSLPQIISELVQNSLDAGARHVDVGVDCEEWGCWIRDDGTGISRDGLAALEAGPDGGRYSTSKAYTPASLGEVTTFGFRGEALASAADLCCLEISSRTARSRESWSIIMKDGKTLYNGPSIRWRRESPGTVVCVRDAFYNLPVRRLSHPPPVRTVELIRKEIEAFALVFPEVSFTLEDTNKAKGGGSRGSRVLTIPKTGSILTSFRNIYGRAPANHVEELNESCGEMMLQGFISMEGAYSRSKQFLYINRHLMATCDLHHLIDQKFSQSTFTKHAYDEAGESSSRPEFRRSPRKTEKKPIYVLNLCIPPRQLDNCLEPAKSTVQLQDPESVKGFLSSVIDKFLVHHGFLVLSQTRKRAPSSSMATPRKRQRPADEPPVPFTATSSQRPATSQRRHDSLPAAQPWLRDIGVNTQDEHIQTQTLWTVPATGESFIIDSITGNSYPQHTPNVQDDDTLDNALLRSGRRTLAPATSGKGLLGDTEDIPEWISAALKENEAYAPTETRIPELPISAFAANVETLCHSGDRSLRSATIHHGRENHVKLGSINLGASRITRFQKEDLRDAQVLGQVDRKFITCVIRMRDGDDGFAIPLAGGTSPEQSAEFERMEQAQGCHRRSLILIDQHAADERIRVERFLKELCLGFLHHSPRASAGARSSEGVVDNVHTLPSGHTVELVPPIPVLLTQDEAFKLMHSAHIQQAFARWGICFAGADCIPLKARSPAESREPRKEDAYSQAFIKSIPEVLSDKLLAGDELRDVVKGYLAKLDAEGFPPMMADPISIPTSASEPNETGFFWQKALRWCPRELLELINSKACRGAIMFNDSLTLGQCTRLLQQLSETALPFQCAHGRPSLVPLADLGQEVGWSGTHAPPSFPIRNRLPVDWTSFT
ncbi:hypothetical protein OBBRIDRAFT_766580 [Obba rivulosa]|uniref:MutL C-terminal dimerisation domain-containing protein n=1 Tax=Obba rivulosa TaxID=1052685 RepID=A0A8E2DU66_9APHY|nr:hypothetical protein OBBRIDRAFT_766580 [Obba rivulosa]